MTENEAVKCIEEYINKCGYTWNLKSIFDEYIKRKNGSYISYTANDVIINCMSAFEKLEQKALQEVQEYRKLGTVEELKNIQNKTVSDLIKTIEKEFDS